MTGMTRFDVGDTAILNAPEDIEYPQVDGQEVVIQGIEEEDPDITDAGFSSDTEEWYEVEFKRSGETAVISGAWLDPV